jgi:uncharacterized damage-inducible protein DinB
MSEVSRISDQLKRAFEGDAWHGPAVMEVLAGVTAEQARARPIENAHTIWEIVLHISAWTDAVRQRVENHSVRLNDAEDWPAPTDREEAWKRALTELSTRHVALMHALERLEDSDLDRSVAGEDYTKYFLLHGLIQHHLYHTGQIALLKKAAGAGK